MNGVTILTENGFEVEKGIELLGDMSTYNSILQEFYNGYYNRMKKIEGYKKNGDMPNYAIEVHSLKSDSKYLGIAKLAELAYNHEMASKANDCESVNRHYNELVIEGNRVVAVIHKYFAETGAFKESIETFESVDEKAKNVFSKQSILVADDSSIIRDFVKDIFSDNYEVLVAVNGKEVIDIVNSNNSIITVLLDLNMPDVDGFQVLEYFKQNDLFKKIPVSIISGANDKNSIDKAFSYNIVDMLNKPFNRENVKRVVEKTIAFKEIDS